MWGSGVTPSVADAAWWGFPTPASGTSPWPREDEARLTERIRELAWKHKAYGYRRITILLLREGFRVNVKRVHRIWKREGLQIP